MMNLVSTKDVCNLRQSSRALLNVDPYFYSARQLASARRWAPANSSNHHRPNIVERVASCCFQRSRHRLVLVEVQSKRKSILPYASGKDFGTNFSFVHHIVAQGPMPDSSILNHTLYGTVVGSRWS